MKKLILISLFLVSACQTQKVIFDSKKYTERHAAYNDGFQNFFISGIGQNKTIYLKHHCDGAENTQEIVVKRSFINILLHGFSNGLYSPRSAKLYCVDK